MTDEELKERVADLIYRRYSRFHEEFPDTLTTSQVLDTTRRRARSSVVNFGEQWEKILEKVGCKSHHWSWNYLDEDTDDLFVRHMAFGVIRVSREVAMKILALGYIP